MKRILTVIAVALLCASVQAQIVRTRSVSIRTEKAPSQTTWYIRGGLNLPKLTGDALEGSSRKAAYNVVVGFQKNFTDLGLYWGMDYGLGSRGFKHDFSDEYEDGSESLTTHNIQVSPATLGWKYEFMDNWKVDVHLGAFLLCDYAGKVKEEYNGEKDSYGISDLEDFQRFDAGLNFGFGVWYGRYNLDFTFQRGFVSVIKDLDCYNSSIMLRLGVAF